MWFWIVSSITGSILGSATSSGFEKTAMGRWFNRKMENIYNWAADRYGFEVLKSEDKWRKNILISQRRLTSWKDKSRI